MMSALCFELPQEFLGRLLTAPGGTILGRGVEASAT
jgi:hypothetical protein